MGLVNYKVSGFLLIIFIIADGHGTWFPTSWEVVEVNLKIFEIGTEISKFISKVNCYDIELIRDKSKTPFSLDTEGQISRRKAGAHCVRTTAFLRDI